MLQSTPEQHARAHIDQLLTAAGWAIQNGDEFNRNAAIGVAVREFALPNGPCDYLLFVDGKAAGVIEAKKTGATLGGVADQAAKYMTKLPLHLATGKTFTACQSSWRLIKHAQAHRIDPDAKVVITTIQRLYAMLRGRDPDTVDDEASAFEGDDGAEGEVPPLAYNPAIPIETFDFIVTDECHRSIYGLWRQVLEYFDASIIGLTATPPKHTLGFFNQNLIAEYPYERSVADGVNVGYEIYSIRTKVTQDGGKIEAGDSGFQVPVRDKRTCKFLLSDDLTILGMRGSTESRKPARRDSSCEAV